MRSAPVRSVAGRIDLELLAIEGDLRWIALLGNREAPLAYVVVSTLLLTAMSVLMTFVFNNARQAEPVIVILHAMYDTVSIGVAPLADTGVPLLAFALSAAVAWLVVGLVILAAPGLRVVRGEPAAAPAVGT